MHSVGGHALRARQPDLLAVHTTFRGEATFEVNKRIVTIDPDRYLIIPRGEPRVVNVSAGTELLEVFFQPEIVARIASELGVAALPHPSGEGAVRYFRSENAEHHDDEVSPHLYPLQAALSSGGQRAANSWFDEQLLRLLAAILRLSKRVEERVGSIPLTRADTRRDITGG